MTLLIDGHNLIGAMPDIDLADPDDEWQLVQRLRAYCAGRQHLTVVFDSGLGPSLHWDLSGGCVQVRFAPVGVEADAVILQLLRRSRRPGQITVVTNDQRLADMVRSEGGLVRSSSQFALRLSRSRELPAAASLVEPQPDPGNPAFADIYQGFVAAEKDEAHFAGEDVGDAAPWIERLYGDDPAEAARAARWLGRFGAAEALESLRDALTHSDGRVRAAALLALGKLGDRQAVGDVAKWLKSDPSSMVREAAAQTLGRLGGVQAEAALQAALGDPKRKVRKAAATSLKQVQARRQH